jgi:guanylate kinase
MSTVTEIAPLVVIVSGPSGSGKSTLVQKILELPGTMPSISCTTRSRRATEASGKCYDFVTEAEFDAMVARGEFLEYARVFGKHSYGTPKKWLEESRKKGLDLVLEIDVQGAAQVKEKLPESVAIFILPPSREELERRLRDRGQDPDEEIARRLAKARDEIAMFGKYYDYCVVNEDVERAGREAQAIVTALRCTSARRRGRVEKLLASFRAACPPSISTFPSSAVKLPPHHRLEVSSERWPGSRPRRFIRPRAGLWIPDKRVEKRAPPPSQTAAKMRETPRERPERARRLGGRRFP